MSLPTPVSAPAPLAQTATATADSAVPLLLRATIGMLD